MAQLTQKECLAVKSELKRSGVILSASVAIFCVSLIWVAPHPALVAIGAAVGTYAAQNKFRAWRQGRLASDFIENIFSTALFGFGIIGQLQQSLQVLQSYCVWAAVLAVWLMTHRSSTLDVLGCET
jgi:hypothetical protein